MSLPCLTNCLFAWGLLAHFLWYHHGHSQDGGNQENAAEIIKFSYKIVIVSSAKADPLTTNTCLVSMYCGNKKNV